MNINFALAQVFATLAGFIVIAASLFVSAGYSAANLIPTYASTNLELEKANKTPFDFNFEDMDIGSQRTIIFGSRLLSIAAVLVFESLFFAIYGYFKKDENFFEDKGKGWFVIINAVGIMFTLAFLWVML